MPTGGDVWDKIELATKLEGATDEQIASAVSEHQSDLSTGEQLILGFSDTASSILGEYPAFDPQAAVDAAKDMAKFNLQLFAKSAKRLVPFTEKIVGEFDEYMAKRFYENIENVLPDAIETIISPQVEALEAVSGLAEQLISGELPTDVQDQIMRQRAELGISQGLFGPAQQYATARDLGLTSLDLQQLGAQLYTQGVSPLATSLQASVMGFQPPTVNLPGLYQSMLGQAVGISSVDPTGVMQTTAQVGISNSQGMWNAQIGVANMAMDAWQTQVMRGLQNDANDAAITSSIIQGTTQLASTAALMALLPGGMGAPAVGPETGVPMTPQTNPLIMSPEQSMMPTMYS